MSELLSKQQSFFVMTAQFFPWLIANGYSATYGEAVRTAKEAALNAAQGDGISNSLHLIRLAIDINIFKGGNLLTSFEELEPVGIFWESIGGSWGGRFKNRDCDHYSLTYKGIR